MRLFCAPLAVLAVACGTTPAETNTTTTTTTITRPPDPPRTQNELPNPWVAMDTHGIRAYVRARVGERIRQAQPDFDLGRIEAYRADPTSAPELAGRTVERLLDLAILSLAEGDLDAAQQIVALVRARARNRNMAYTGSTILAEVARRRAGDDVEAQKTAIMTVLRDLPPNRLGPATVLYQIYQTPAQVSANAEQTRAQMLSLETASSVLYFTQVLPTIVEKRDLYLSAVQAVREERGNRGPREFRFSTFDVGPSRPDQPIVMGVWDVGTAPNLFERQLYSNPREQANGADDDQNGQVDDIHGIVSDASAPNTALLYEPSAEVLSQYGPFLRGIMDLRAGLADSEAAQRVLALFRDADSVEELETLERNLDAIGEWAHGTHVAGIMLAQNPHARLAIFRSAWAGESRTYFHRGPTDEELAAERANAVAVAAFINANNVRVVNASLGFSRDYLEDALRHESSRYRTNADVEARAEQVMAHRQETWRTVFTTCANTLFVIAAGNSNRDVVEYGDVPAALDLPNVLAVGAVDKFGAWATFTNSNPERVRIFDLGVEVESLVPSGDRTPLSGTSMASPNVANLAGKMLVMAPNLRPQDIIEIIVDTGDPIAAPFNGRIANERRAISRAQLRGD
jgi:hypothetical protein